MKATSFILAACLLVTASSRATSPLFAEVDAAALSALPSADEVMTQAKARAAAEHKNIQVVFSASWCGPCKLFEVFLEDPKTGPIMDKYFVTARLDVGEKPTDKRHSNSPGAEAFRASLGGATAGYPYIIFLDQAGKPIVNSYRPVRGNPNGENIGYPALPVEVDWFMKMLQQSAPAMSTKEPDTIQKWLHERGHN